MSYKLKPSIKKKWVEALRNGGYVKNHSRLYSREYGKDCFCALGVLVNETVGFIPWDGKKDEYAIGVTRDSETFPSLDLLPKVFRKDDIPKYWESIVLEYKGANETIYGLNDNYELSFKQLANLIEKQL